MKKISKEQLLIKVQELENRLEESEQLIQAIKAGEVDAFAITNQDEAEIYTLKSIDYAYRILIEEIREGALTVTAEGLIVYTNSYFCELLNLPYERVIGRSIFDLVHPDSREELKRLFEESLTGKSKGEIDIYDGGKVPVYISLTSLQPHLPNVGIIITNLTEKKKNESIVLEYQKELERKNLDLINTNTELSSFSHITSHDLQEPLRKIQTFTNLIEEHENDNLSREGMAYFNKIKISACRMQTLIQDLLAYSRARHEERKFVRTNLNEILDDVKEDLKEELEKMNARIEAYELGEANIIPFQFRQVMQNLIANSLKFSKQEDSPVISIQSIISKGKELQLENLLPDKEYCHIKISDNGIGFESKYNEKIFEIFQRLHGKERFSGSGIGLSIVKKIIDNHNGIITASGELDKGATFDIYIPA